MPDITIDGTSISGITINGTDVQEVTIDGTTVWTSTPSTLVNRLPMNEGSGTSIADTIGNGDGTLYNSGTWTSNTAFRGDTAPTFDQSDDYGEWFPRTTTPITWTVRVRVDSNFSNNVTSEGTLFGHDFGPAIIYNTADGKWVLYDNNYTEISVSESTSSAEGSIRIVAGRMDSNSMALDVYENPTTKLGGSTYSNPDTTFGVSTCYLGSYDGANNFWGDVIDLFDVHDSYLSDSTLDDTISSVYG